MLIFKPILFCILTLFISLILKNTMPQFIPFVILCSGTLVFLYILPFIKSITDTINSFQVYGSQVAVVVKNTFKIVTIAIICEFASQLCSDSGETYLAAKIIFVGKIAILTTILHDIIKFINYITDIANQL